MEISNANKPVSSTATPLPIGELSELLSRSGPIEARVLKLLDGGLLLGSRLGEILTSNNLKFKVGDRLTLRIDGDAGKPLLRVTAATPRPILIDLRDAPALTRLLLPGRPQLASVVAHGAEKMQFKIDNQRLSTTAHPGLRKGQLVSLLRSAERHSVEIRPLDARPVFKALVTRLIAARYDSGRPAALVSLLRLLHQANPAALPAATQRDSRSTTYQQPPGQAHVAAAKPVAAITPSSSVVTSSPAASPQFDQAAIKSMLARFPPSPAPGDIAAARPQAVTPAQSPVRPLMPGPGPSAAASPSALLDGEARSLPSLQLPPVPAAVKNQLPGTTATSTQQQVAQPSTRLQLLLQSLQQIEAFNPARLKQWFEYAGLLRADSANPVNSRINPFQLLRQIAPAESFIGQLLQPVPASAKAQQQATAGSKSPAQLDSAALIREAGGLLEQALGQNLMQRALLGLQQETQQPLSLSMALPFVDQGEVKSLQIELEQRNQAEDEEDRSWEVRLDFELGDLGQLCCHIILQGNKVSASFYSAEEQARSRIDGALGGLREQLAGAGFLPGEFFSFTGKPAKPSRPQGLRFSESLLDIEV